MITEQLIEQLLKPETYPHPVEVITTIETHISIVFLTGQFAYKLKKPVNFGFLDFSQLSYRKKFCELELSLNKRTAPDLYLEVCPLYMGATNEASFSPLDELHSEAFEYLVKMNQFDPNQVLGRYLQQETLKETQRRYLVENIANFHSTAEAVKPSEPYGQFNDLVKPMLDNFPSLFECFEHPETQYRLRQLVDWTKFTHQSLRNQLEARRAQGKVKACHGDMHLDNITLVNDKPMLFDGIEFNEQFRWIDVANDLSFLLIDLDNRKQTQLKRLLLSEYLSITGDYNCLNLLSFYQVYRAMVRSKITALRYQQVSELSPEKQQTWDLSHAYLKQAEDYAYQLKHPAIILMQGVSGSGKSYYANNLLKQVDAIVISSDVERKRLHSISPLTRVKGEERKRLYSSKMSQQTYQHLLLTAEKIVQAGYIAIVDATFLKASHRLPFIELAKAQNIPLAMFSIADQGHQSVLEQQISQRLLENTNPSDADIDVMKLQLTHNEPPTSNESEWIWHHQPNQPLNAKAFFDWFDVESIQEFNTPAD